MGNGRANLGALWSSLERVLSSSGAAPPRSDGERIPLGRRLPWLGSTRGHPSAWRSSGQPLVRPPGPVSSRAPGVLRRPGDGAPAATRGDRRGVARTEHDGEGTTPRRRGNAGMHGPSARRRGQSPRLTPTPALGVVDVPARRRGGSATTATVRARGRGGRGSRGPGRRSRRRRSGGGWRRGPCYPDNPNRSHGH